MPESPTIAEVIREAMRANREELHVAMPGIVQAVNASRGTVDVIPQLRRPVERRDGTFAVEDLPVIPDVPVIFPRANGFSVKMPVAVGDPVQVVFNERDLGIWREQGEPGLPGDNRCHTLAGAVAMPGLFTNEDAPAIPGANMEIGHEGTNAATIEITPSEVRLTKGSSNLIARADRVEAELQHIVDAITNGVPGVNDGGTAYQTSMVGLMTASGVPNSTGTDNIKGD